MFLLRKLVPGFGESTLPEFPTCEPPAATDPNATIITAINDATTALNATIEQAVAARRATDVKIVYVDGTAEFAGYGIGSTKPFINDGWLDKPRQQV